MRYLGRPYIFILIALGLAALVTLGAYLAFSAAYG